MSGVLTRKKEKREILGKETKEKYREKGSVKVEAETGKMHLV